MEALEVVLRKVEDLRRDLNAEIIVQKEEGHNEEKMVTGQGGSKTYDYDPGWTENVWVVDKPELREPDTEKRESAKNQLQQIYDSSEWYSARYAAGRTLGIDVDGQVKHWVSELQGELFATRKEPRVVKEIGGYEDYDPKGYYRGSNRVETLEEVTKTFDMVDREIRLKAIRDAGELLRLSNSQKVKSFLRTIYTTGYYSLLLGVCEEVDDYGNDIKTGFIPHLRKRAGRELGYSSLRIWAHDHPIAATVTGIATAGAASGLVYMLIQYTSR